jgi:hypothetical protein
VNIKKKNLTRLASISALGAGALGVTTKTAHAGIVYTTFSPPKPTVGFSASISFSVSQLAPGGNGGFQLFTRYTPTTHPLSNGYSGSAFLKVMMAGLNGLNFQDAPGPGFIWNNTAPVWNSKALRSKRTFFKYTVTTRKYTPLTNGQTKTTTQFFPHTAFGSTILIDRTGDFFLLFQFNPTGTQTDYGWIHLNGLCNCGLDTEVVEFAYDDTGNLLATGQNTPEPATMFPTGLAALALGATGIRRWRKARKKAA